MRIRPTYVYTDAAGAFWLDITTTTPFFCGRRPRPAISALWLGLCSLCHGLLRRLGIYDLPMHTCRYAHVVCTCICYAAGVTGSRGDRVGGCILMCGCAGEDGSMGTCLHLCVAECGSKAPCLMPAPGLETHLAYVCVCV